MIVHLVLFRPRADLAAGDRASLADAFTAALRDIPSVRRAHVGRRVLTGRAYEQAMRAHYEYTALLEFDDLAGLQAYLDHPVHAALAARFYDTLDDALTYDYELQEGPDAVARLMRGN